MFTPEERKIAQTLAKSKETMEFLTKVFLPEKSGVRAELEKNVAALDDEEYGRLMKALYLAESHAETGLGNIKLLGSAKESAKKSPIAPKQFGK